MALLDSSVTRYYLKKKQHCPSSPKQDELVSFASKMEKLMLRLDLYFENSLKKSAYFEYLEGFANEKYLVSFPSMKESRI